jgi:hypothetical protein
VPTVPPIDDLAPNPPAQPTEVAPPAGDPEGEAVDTGDAPTTDGGEGGPEPANIPPADADGAGEAEGGSSDGTQEDIAPRPMQPGTTSSPIAPPSGPGGASGATETGSGGTGRLAGLLLAIPALGIGLAALVLVRRGRREEDVEA